jgi:hypothetical protein
MAQLDDQRPADFADRNRVAQGIEIFHARHFSG